MNRILRALLSVSDKTGLVDFARGLSELGITLISTGGTAKALTEAGLTVIGISDITQFPEMLDGRVKTLHPAVHGGLLADRSKPEHMATIAKAGIEPIDLVVVNLYPFAETVANPDVTREEAIENIDIGGPSMIRSAAKNHSSVAVVVSPARYQDVLAELKANHSALTTATLQSLAAEAFSHTAAYDSGIAAYLNSKLSERTGQNFPDVLTLAFTKIQSLRYGENPHQKATFYKENRIKSVGLAGARKLHGKELSFNNIYDLNAAFNLVLEFADGPDAAAAIIKHTNPCGVALSPTLDEAFRRARAADPISAFGGILATSRMIDAATAELITGKNTFFEAIIAPGYDTDAITILTEKKQWGSNLILLEAAFAKALTESFDYKRISGGLLVQSTDDILSDHIELTEVTRRGITAEERKDLLFAWTIVKHVKSNAIVLAKGLQLVGIGAGQMNRVQSVRLAVEQAGPRAKGSVMASDAFFPFSDGPESAGKAGVVAIIQPGGSKKDDESIAMADTYNMAMVFTGRRHFRH